MDFDYSIENLADLIHNPNTKKYFQEVYQTYINKNYRSATVMLYSVLICDLVYKLRDLKDIYSDSDAKFILDEVEELWRNNQQSSKWESTLIEKIKSRTNWLESSDKLAIQSLQKYRHLSAHPVLESSDLLFSPNKETVQSLIRNILEGILINPPLFSNKIFDVMLEDLVAVKEQLSEEESLNKYVTARYESHFKDNDFRKIFRSLWKLAFILEDEKSVQHADLLQKVLCIFTVQRRNICLELVQKEPDYYSNIRNSVRIPILVRYLAQFPKMYKFLQEPLQLLIQNSLSDFNCQFLAWFLDDPCNIEMHLNKIREHWTWENRRMLSYDSINLMGNISNENGFQSVYIDFLINYLSSSGSFDESRNRFGKIECFLKDMTLSHARKLLKVSNANPQIYCSNYGHLAERIKQICEKFEKDIDKNLYPDIYAPQS